MEIPEYKDWVKKMSEAPELEIDTDSFKFLFYKWNESKPKEQTHKFFEAYACATSKLKRFPNVDEIEKTCPDILKSKGQNQVGYNLKRRLKNNTEFFEEFDFGKKGVYLIPKALKFKDRGGKYSNLVFDFEKGIVTMPKLEQTPIISLTPDAETKSSIKDETTENTAESNKTSVASSQNNEKKSLPLKSVIFFSLIFVVLAALVFQIFSYSNTSTSDENYIIYSINNSKDEEGDFIMFYLINPDNIMINSSIMLPTGVFQSFSAEKGTFSSSFPPDSNYTIIRWKTNEDSKMKIYIKTIEKIPFELTLYNHNDRNIRLHGIDNFEQTKNKENIIWNFEIKQST